MGLSKYKRLSKKLPRLGKLSLLDGQDAMRPERLAAGRVRRTSANLVGLRESPMSLKHFLLARQSNSLDCQLEDLSLRVTGAGLESGKEIQGVWKHSTEKQRLRFQKSKLICPLGARCSELPKSDLRLLLTLFKMTVLKELRGLVIPRRGTDEPRVLEGSQRDEHKGVQQRGVQTLSSACEPAAHVCQSLERPARAAGLQQNSARYGTLWPLVEIPPTVPVPEVAQPRCRSTMVRWTVVLRWVSPFSLTSL